MLAMQRAVLNLRTVPEVALVDGNSKPTLFCKTQCLIGGDSKALSISAASIVDKVSRDAIMSELAKTHSGYGWERNQGYGTKEHMDAIKKLGVTAHHRKSFAPVAAKTKQLP